MDLASQFAAFLERERVQAASVASLSSQVVELSSTVARLSADNAHLSSENADLKLKVADQNKVLADVSRAAIPGGHWVWESASTGSAAAGGRWVWSLEHYQPTSSAVVRSGPPASLLALPVELLAIIVALVPAKELPQLSLVCFRLLEVASRLIYPRDFRLQPKHAFRFVCSRLEDLDEKSLRISTVLLPSQVLLARSSPHKWHAALDLFSGSDLVGVIDIKDLVVELTSVQSIHRFVPLFSRLNPARFELRVGARDGWVSSPGVYHLSQAATDALFASWTRLEQTLSVGPESVLLSSVDDSQMALGACLRRGARAGEDLARLASWLITKTVTKGTQKKRVMGADVAAFLAEEHTDPGGDVKRVCLTCWSEPW